MTIETELESLLDEISEFIFSRSQENLVKNESMDTGFLLRSGRIDRMPLKRIIIYDAPYADFVEYGTRPHPMSGSHLEGWVRRKLGIRGKKAKSVAFAIARKISREGTDPKPFMRPAINEAKMRFPQL